MSFSLQHNKIFVLLGLPVISTLMVLFFKLNFFVSTLLFFGLPVIYLIFLNKKILFKSLVFSILFAVPFWVLVDLLATVNGSWEITNSIFPTRFLGIVTYENLVFAFLWILSVILFYETFFDKGKKKDKNPKSLYYLSLFWGVPALILSVLFLINSAWVFVPYFYAIFGIFIGLPVLFYFLYKYKQFIAPLTVTTAYFFVVLMLFEFVALKTHLWYFPGNQFLGFVDILGVRMPFEEFFLWGIFATPCLVAYYELFSDDRKLG